MITCRKFHRNPFSIVAKRNRKIEKMDGWEGMQHIGYICRAQLWRNLRGVYSDTTQLNSTRQREQQLTQFVGGDVINKNKTNLAVRCSTACVS